jgi:hypothetical protein
MICGLLEDMLVRRPRSRIAGSKSKGHREILDIENIDYSIIYPFLEIIVGGEKKKKNPPRN